MSYPPFTQAIRPVSSFGPTRRPRSVSSNPFPCCDAIDLFGWSFASFLSFPGYFSILLPIRELGRRFLPQQNVLTSRINRASHFFFDTPRSISVISPHIQTLLLLPFSLRGCQDPGHDNYRFDFLGIRNYSIMLFFFPRALDGFEGEAPCHPSPPEFTPWFLILPFSIPATLVTGVSWHRIPPFLYALSDVPPFAVLLFFLVLLYPVFLISPLEEI